MLALGTYQTMIIQSRFCLTMALLPALACVVIAWQDPATALPGAVPLVGHKDAVYGVAFSPDGTTLATASFDKTIGVWDSSTGRLLHQLGGPQGHTDSVLSVAVAPSGALLASVGADNTARIWDMPRFVPSKTWLADQSVPAFSVAADGKTVAAIGGKDGLVIFQLDAMAPGGTKQLLKSPLADKTTALAWSPDAKTIAHLDTDGHIHWLMAADGKEIAAWAATEGPAQDLVWQSTGIGILGTDGMVRTVTPPTTPNKTLGKSAAARVESTPDGGFVAWGGGSAGFAVLNGQGETVREVPVAGAPPTLVIQGGPGNGWTVTQGDEVSILQPTGAVIGKFKPGASVTSMTWHQNRLVLGLADGKLAAWEAPPAANMPWKNVPNAVPAQAHAGAVLAVASIRDRLVSVGADGLKTWNTLGQPGPAAAAPGGPVTSAAFTRDGQVGVLITGKSIAAIQPYEAKIVKYSPVITESASAALSADGKRLFVLGKDDQVRIVDLTSGDMVGRKRLVGATAVAVPGQGTTMVVATKAKPPELIPVPAIAMLFKEGKTPLLRSSPNGAWLVARGPLESIPAGRPMPEKAWPQTAPILDVVVAKSGQMLVANSTGLTVTAPDGKLVGAIPLSGLRAAVPHPSLPIVALFTAAGTQIRSIAPVPMQPNAEPFGKLLQTLPLVTIPGAVAWIGTEGDFVVLGPKAGIDVWRMAAETPRKTLAHPAIVACVSFSPDGKLVATGCHDGKVRIWDSEKGTIVREIAAHVPVPPNTRAPQIYAVAFHPNGTILASASEDRSIKLWTVANGQLAREIKGFNEKDAPKGHHDAVFSLAFSVDGAQLASGSADRSIKIWNSGDGALARELADPKVAPFPSIVGQPPLPLAAHGGWVTAVAYGKDGSLVSLGLSPRQGATVARWPAGATNPSKVISLPAGPWYSLTLDPVSQRLAFGTGANDTKSIDINRSWIAPLP